MTSIEKLSNDLYETLLQLRYPGLAQAASKDMSENVLAHENRLFLLSWLLAQSSLVKDNELSTDLDELKIAKWYSNMGICNNADVLMGRVPLQEQVFALKNLLLFARNVLCTDQSGDDCNNQTQVMDSYKKCMSESVSIMPSTLGLAKKLTYNEAIRYLDHCRDSLSEKTIIAEKSPNTKKNDLSSDPAFGSMGSNNSGCNNESDRRECIEKFLQAFADASSWPKSEIADSALISTKSMDNCIENIHSNMGTLKETFQSKDEISNSNTMEQLDKREMPLDGPIEDIVIAIEEVSRLQIIE